MNVNDLIPNSAEPGQKPQIEFPLIDAMERLSRIAQAHGMTLEQAIDLYDRFSAGPHPARRAFLAEDVIGTYRVPKPLS